MVEELHTLDDARVRDSPTTTSACCRANAACARARIVGIARGASHGTGTSHS